MQQADESFELEQQVELYSGKAMLLWADQRYDEVVAVWDQLLALEPALPQAWYNRGVALDRLGSHDLALESYDRVIELEPRNHLAWGNRAIALRKLGRHDDAKAAAKRAFELNPEDMVESFFRQLRLKQPKLNFLWAPLESLVMRLRGLKQVS